MDIFEGKNKRYCKRLTKFGRNIVLRIKPRAAMFVVRFANLSLARYLTNPRVIAWLPALKGPLEPRLLTEILLFWASLKHNVTKQNWKRALLPCSVMQLSIACILLQRDRKFSNRSLGYEDTDWNVNLWPFVLTSSWWGLWPPVPGWVR